ncbi:Zn-ribbon domain-containing OB-fold protein [Denitratisoma sp. DHT3]|uniref:Zn-ribbon domain-containing OB-fold protein n=1 Tax=Denitratisoma sp. DHT3 TaxID=1981880 RepID=UPI0016479E25|nr:OB-fold domain-containing protein [Denitratisoma sp. DHT3]
MAGHGRIKPPMGRDNGWWWEQAAQGVVAIQRCSGCGTLRHPPRPMCSECRSLEWDFIPAGGQGTVLSYTVLYHPQFPGYEYPLTTVLVDLEEGVRMTATLKDCDPADVKFGMKVSAFIHEDPDGFKIPMFRPAAQEKV